MNWTEIKKIDYLPIQCMDGVGNVYHLLFSPVDVDAQPTEENPNPGDAKAIFVRTEKHPTVEEVRDILKNLIIEYDSSREVNKFNYKDFTYWFDRELRVSLMYKFNVLLESNIATGTVWFGSYSYDVDTEKMLAFLKELEYYAIQTNDVTLRHLNEIKTINTIDELIRYNITKDYPQPVTIPNNVFKD